jgi:uncharacterized repeat protein (TIGR01451 family)
MIRARLQRPSRTTSRAASRAVMLAVAGMVAAGPSMALALPSPASTPGAAWALASSHAPTSLQAGGVAGYVITATNVGNAPANGGASEITLSDTLPAELTATEIVGVDVANSSFLPCDLHTLLCTDPGVVAPGDELIVKITASVSSLTPPSLINTASVSGGGASGASAREVAGVGISAAGFGFQSFTAQANNADGSVDTLAGDHPYSATTSFTVDTVARGAAGSVATDRDVKDLAVNLPAGFLGDPSAVPQCRRAIFALPVTDWPASVTEQCPIDSQVGVATVALTFGGTKSGRDVYSAPVYNLAPQDGVPADVGFTLPAAAAINVDIAARLRTGGDYGVTATVSDVTELEEVLSTSLTLWGVPGDPGHDAQRGRACSAPLKPGTTPQCLNKGGHSFTGPVKPFLTNPTDCAAQALAPPLTTLEADSWQNPGVFTAPTQAVSPSVIGCELLRFDPSLSLTPETSRPGTPTGLAVDLAIPQTDVPNTLATPQLKDATVTLPQGLVLSPSAADGLAGCSDAQIALSSAGSGSCPPASKIATVQVHTPPLDHPLSGAVYLGTPLCAPCANTDAQSGRMLRLFIEVNDPASGVVVKLPGTVSADPATGQLTASFRNNPQLPFDDLQLRFKGGARAALATPSTCGTFTTTTDLSPWSAPFTPDATPSSAFDIVGCGDPNLFAPSFTAGTTNAQAGAFTPFTLTFSRQDADQQLAGLTVTLPAGLLAKLAGVPLCSDGDANAGTCPAASRIGSVSTGAGPGTRPFYLPGQVFLTGPYNGGPYGLAVEVPAIAGPFNLGTVVVRQSLRIDARDAHVTAVSDPLPRILDGVPLQIRTVSVTLDRPGFTLNPTSCDPMRIDATLTSVGGIEAPVGSRFQVGGCASLPFKPGLSATTQAKTSKAAGASLTVKVAQRAGEAAIRRVELTLPAVLPARLTTLQKACTQAQFNTNPAGCPPASLVGSATAITPLLGVPLTGPAYLVSHGGAAFPDIVFLLQGGGIQIDLVGRTDIKRGVTYSRFDTVPDAPLTSFTATLPEGPHSVLAAHGDLCKPTKTVTVKMRVVQRRHGRIIRATKRVRRVVPAPLSIPTTLVGQNGAAVRQTTRIAVGGCPRHRPARVRARPLRSIPTRP